MGIPLPTASISLKFLSFFNGTRVAPSIRRAMRKGLLIFAVVAMTVLGFYAAYRAVMFTITVAHDLTRTTELARIASRPQ